MEILLWQYSNENHVLHYHNANKNPNGLKKISISFDSGVNNDRQFLGFMRFTL